MKKLLFVLILLAAGGSAAYYYYNYGKPKEKPSVQVVAVSKGSIVEVVQSTGTLEALRTVQVGSQVSGTVKDLFNVDFNSIVKKGQKIAQLDDSLLAVQVRIQEANIERQRGDIENQKVQLQDAVRNLGRQKELSAKGLSKQQDLEQADLAVKSREASISSAEKSIISSEAQLQQAKLNVEYCTIYAPIDGVVVDRKVDIGQTVQSSMTTPQFFTIATDLTKLKLTAGVDEAEIGKVQAGQEVLFTVDSYQGVTFAGTVTAVRLNATTQNNVVTYPVWIDVPNNDLKLRPSMTANIRVVIRKVDDATRVPNGAFRFKPNKEIYLALGLPEPAAGRGQRLADANGGAPGGGRADQGGDPNSAPPATSTAPTTPGQAPGSNPAQGVAQGGRGQGQPGQGGRGGQGAGQNAQAGQGGGQNPQNAQGGQGRNRTPGQGFGGQSGLTDEQRAAAMQAFINSGGNSRTGGRGGGGGGRGGAGGGGRTPNAGRGGQGVNGRFSGTPANATGDQTPMTERNADKIDELFQPIPQINNRQQVWTWDEAKKELKAYNVTLGVTDGQFSQLVAGDITVGQQLVTGVILPVVKTTPGQMNPLFGNQPGRNPGGMMPGGNPGGGPGGGGGGGGRGGGGGGGGRGGGN